MPDYMIAPSILSADFARLGEEVDTVLRRHEAALRLLYARTCAIHGVSMSGGLRNKMVSVANWREFVRLFGLVGPDLNERDVSLCFAWSAHTASSRRPRSPSAAQIPS